MRALMNTKMDEETLVREQILKIFDHLNTLEIIGGEIDVESQIELLILSLSRCLTFLISINSIVV